MKDYHFERDEHDFDQTIRLDDINKEMKKLEDDQPEDDLGDKDAFLDAFESEKFDSPPMDDAQKIPADKGGASPDQKEDEPFFNKKMLTLLAVVSVVITIACFVIVRSVVFSGSKNEGLPVVQTPMLIQGALVGGELIVYDINEDANKSIAITEKTEITDAQGQITTDAQLNNGDLILVQLDQDGKSVLSINLGGKIETAEETGLTADTISKQLRGEGKTFSYGEQAMFLYNQEAIQPKELEPCDVLTLKSYDNIVWSVEVKEYHGYISVENKDNIVNGMFQLDAEEAVLLANTERIAVKEGTHTITVWGDNIEKRTDSIFVGTGEAYLYDLSKAQEKVGVLMINANVSDYKLYINGTLVDSTVPSVLPLGEYDVVILKTGYAEWSQHIALNTDTVSIDATLQKDLQYGTVTISANVEGAQLLIDGKDMGTAPIELNLPYGSYSLAVEKSGYAPFSTTLSVNSSSSHVKIDLVKE